MRNFMAANPLDFNADLILKEGVFSKESVGITEKEMDKVYAQAKKLYEAGKFEDARTLFSALVLLDSQTPAFLYGFASSCLMLKQYEGAAEAFLEYAALVPNDPLPYFFIAECYEKKNDIISTMIALQTVINRAKDQPQYQEIKNRASLILDSLKNMVKEREVSRST